MSISFVLNCDKCGGYSRVAEACTGGDGHKEIEPYFCAHCGTHAGSSILEASGHRRGYSKGPLKKQIEEAN
jgi:hypothetical protein